MVGRDLLRQGWTALPGCEPLLLLSHALCALLPSLLFIALEMNEKIHSKCFLLDELNLKLVSALCPRRNEDESEGIPLRTRHQKQQRPTLHLRYLEKDKNS